MSALARRAATALSADGARALDDLAEFAFKRTYKLTEDDDLASQVSDDVLLIGGAVLSGFEDEWLNALWLSYRVGSFPHRPLRPVGGQLRSLLASNEVTGAKKPARRKATAKKQPPAKTKAKKKR